MNSDHGTLFTVKYLKACHVALQRYLSGNRVHSLQEIEPGLPFPRLKRGLPPFILSMDRKEIRNLNPKVIRWWLSILSIYRVIEAPRKVKLNTITDGPKFSYAVYSDLVFKFKAISIEAKRGRSSLFHLRNLKSDHLRPSTKAGPNGSLAFTGLFGDAAALSRDQILLEAFRTYASITKSGLLDLFEKTLSLAQRAHSSDMRYCASKRRGTIDFLDEHMQSRPLLIYPEVFEEYDVNHVKDRKVITKITRPGAWHDFQSGRLVGIPEPAGKMRVIAICDLWTQSLFAPLHNVLFRFLRTLPNDGTFDQNAAFDRAVIKGNESPSGIFCADLSAATDRLPIDLQVSILKYLFRSNELAEAWGDLFRQRSFILREPLLDIPAHTSVRYGTGQPMGCLSSWAMLAVCHHFIVQACCVNVGMSKHVWHTCYEILGDDIVIFDKDVYIEYVRVMTELGVETNPSKSIISDKGVKVLEFAKRTALNGVEVSGLSWKQLASTARWKDIIPLILSLGDRHLISSHGILIRLLKFNFKSSWRKEAKLPNAKSKMTKHLNNLVFSLLNHFSHIGMMDLRSTYAYVVDTRNGKEGFPITGNLPLTTAVCDLFEMFKSLSDFRQTGFFDVSKIRLNALSFRDHLVGAKLLPYWGHNLDAEAIKAFERFRFLVPDFPQTIVHFLINWPKGFAEKELNEELRGDLYNHCLLLANDLVYQGKDDYQRVNELRERLIKSFSLTERDIEQSLTIHHELNLFVMKYDFITKLISSPALQLVDKVPWPMKEVRAAVLAEQSFISMKDEFGVDSILELDSTQRMALDFLSAQETFVLCDDFEFEDPYVWNRASPSDAST
jgi:hypothetical protein